MKKIATLSFLFFLFSTFSIAQSNEGQLVEITSRVKIYLPSTDEASLEGENRYIQIGILGNENDVNELVGYMDRFAIKDKDMIAKAESTISEEMINYFKFYLNPLYDANDFQLMLEMYGIKKYFMGSEEHSVEDFSNMIYASIKSKK